MISFFREFTKSLAFKLIMAALVLSFGVFGMNDLLAPSLDNSVITAGNRKVSAQAFRDIFDNYKKNLEKENGGQVISNEDAVKANLHVQIIDQLAQNEAFNAWLAQTGIKPAPQAVIDEIRKIPNFFNAVTGQFDKKNYQQALAGINRNEATFEGEISDGIAAQQFGTAALSGLQGPKIMAALQTSLGMEQRNADFFVLNPNMMPVPTVPTDTELATFYKEKRDQMKQPELRRFSVVSFSPADYEANIVIDEEALKKQYEFTRETLSKPETRSFIQISTKNAKDAAAISLALKNGQDPNAVAKAHHGEVITYSQKPKTAVPDQKIGVAAFGLAQGEVSGVIQGDLSLAVIKMGQITAGSVVSFETARPKLVAEYRRQKALDKVDELSDAFDADRATGTDLLTAAKKLNLHVTPFPLMTAEGQSQQRSFAEYAKLIKIAFDQPKGGESEVEPFGNGVYFALKVDEIIPAQTPSLEKIKPELTRAYMINKMNQALQDKSSEVVARIRKGTPLSTIAAELKAPILNVSELDRQSAAKKLALPGQDPRASQVLVSKVFTSKKGEAFSQQIGQFQYIIGSVSLITPPTQSQIGTQMPIAQMMASQSLSGDFNMSVLSGARQIIKTKTYPKTAVRALGVAPPETQDPKKKKDIASQ